MTKSTDEKEDRVVADLLWEIKQIVGEDNVTPELNDELSFGREVIDDDGKSPCGY